MKKRLPIKKLREEGAKATEMLKERGIIARESIIEEIAKKEDAPALPGIPPYLPHEWTLKASQRMMYDLLVIWRDENKKKGDRVENITEFFKFVVSELRKQEEKYKKQVDVMPSMFKKMRNNPTVKDVFSPLRKMENTHAIQRFFIDSFAVAIILKNNHTVSDYANWFLDWTEKMYSLWVHPDKREKQTKI